MATIQAILALHRSGHSNRGIARLLGVNRETVAEYLRAAETQNRPDHPSGGAPPTESPDESTVREDAKRAIAPGPPSQCEQFRETIAAKVEAGLSAVRIFQDLVEEGFEGKYWSVRRYVTRLTAHHDPPMRRLETLPGDEAQIDFGTGASVLMPDGRRRRPWVFRVVLSHSRKAYSEAVWRQTTEAFLQCLENAFHHFGGVPRRLVLDNLKAAVAQADWYDPEVHPKLQSVAAHYGTASLPTKPYTPRHKGKIERGIGYTKNNALKGRVFQSLEEENQFLLGWEGTVANTRILPSPARKAFGPA